MLFLRKRDRMLRKLRVRKIYILLKTEVFILPSRIAAFVFVFGLLTLPFFTQDAYLLRILILTSIFAIYAASWDLLSGFTGQMNFGHALFFGVAAYTAAFLNIHGHLRPYITIPLGALAAVISGTVIGIPSLRLKGAYLALTTLAFPIILMGIVFGIPNITGGELGLSEIDPLSNSRLSVYYITVVLMLSLNLVMWKLTDSKTGIILHAIREDELAAKASGVNTTYYKLMAFCLSGFFAGIAGGLYAHVMNVVGPSTLEVWTSFQAVIWTVFGGMVSIYGPIAGVFILFPLMEYLRIISDLRFLIFALVLSLTLLFMPEGIIPWIRDKIETLCPRCKNRNFVRSKTCRVCSAQLY